MGRLKGFSSLSPKVQRAILRHARDERPFLVSAANWLSNKVPGTRNNALNKAYAKYINEPITKADVSLGLAAQRAQRRLFGKSKDGKWRDTAKLFTEKKNIGLGKKRGGMTGNVEYDVPSITAPVSKTGKFVIPLLGAMKLEEIVKGKKKMSDQNKIITEADLKKTASMLSHLHSRNKQLEKKAHATKLLYKQAELGQIIFPKTHEEFEVKVAELMHKDLNVVEEAIKMAAASEELNNTFGGSLTSQATGAPSGNAQQAFQRSIIGE